ncbi:hemolysin activator protein precursor [Bartonella tribocorum CIP 105476]|uniref:Hemolysin activator protein n=1 Tax=Bartonella tribocorum (strain DSM 28219 / CCUG 45778 / CIP 105476 / IBS 506) TaxID=382640 RepID=A9ITG3_BART1|nr:ShlB/FhaC/HecB family hemolysin secretion/activation protein [Bartonella tribocorum]CAK01425.1 hemolysin activator protein precursor [Bartonella tribocorum CIP 105476]
MIKAGQSVLLFIFLHWKSFLRFFLALVLFSMLSGVSVYARSPAVFHSPTDNFSRGYSEKQQLERIENLRALTPKGIPMPSEGNQGALWGSGYCFPIHDIVVDGVYHIKKSAIAAVTNPYVGRCIGLVDIQLLIKQLTKVYLDQGYVTARFYIPDQDIKNSKVLKFVVVEGKLSDIYYNGLPASSHNYVVWSAFPGLEGHILNMRDIEQGLDQINRLFSGHAQSELLPGREEGSTIVNINNQPSKAFKVRVSHDNMGQSSTGYARYSAGLKLENILGLNDAWNFSYQRSQTDYWGGSEQEGHSNNISASVSIPYGYWTFGLNGTVYNYQSIIHGNFTDIETTGDSSELHASTSRVLHRDSVSLTTLNVGLSYKRTNNYLLGNKIEVGSRQYSVANFGISHSRQMFGGTWTFDVSYLQGPPLFHSVKKHTPGAGDGEPQFAKFTGTLSVMTPFKVGEWNFLLSNLLSGQYSPHNLLAAEQISLGGTSNVRGTRESLIFGNNGFFTRNDLMLRTIPWSNSATLKKTLGELRPYVGLDYGRVFSQALYGFTSEQLAGWTAGIKLSGGMVSLDASYSSIFWSTVKHKKSGTFLMTLAMEL